jgi:hypothetical protein
MKRHGLWRFHYESTQARNRYKDVPMRWWIPEEEERCYRMISCMFMGQGWSNRWSNADALVVCAKRYARRFGGVRTVADWNALILLIAKRSGYTHYATLRSAEMHYTERRKSPIRFSDKHLGDGRSSRPYCRFSSPEIQARHAQIIEARRIREMNEQQQNESAKRAIFSQLWEAKQAIHDINKAIKSAQAAMKERV